MSTETTEAIYVVKNMVRRPQTRHTRHKAPAPQKFVQHICGGRRRIPINRFVRIPHKELMAYYDELWKKEEAGAIEVRVGTPAGPLFIFGEKEQTPVSPPAEPKAEEVSELEEEKAELEEPELEEEEEPEELEEPELEKEPELEESLEVDSFNKEELIDSILELAPDEKRYVLQKMKKDELADKLRELLG